MDRALFCRRPGLAFLQPGRLFFGLSKDRQIRKNAFSQERMRKTKFVKLKLRHASFISRALLSTGHPVLAHLIPMRRCNLACGYCNEYDHSSSPVPLDVIKQRLDRLAILGTSIVTISGGEPMMHPQLDEIIHYICFRGMSAGLISNGYYFTTDR